MKPLDAHDVADKLYKDLQCLCCGHNTQLVIEKLCDILSDGIVQEVKNRADQIELIDIIAGDLKRTTGIKFSRANTHILPIDFKLTAN